MSYSEDYVCDVCGLLYDKDLHSDVIEHRRVHDRHVNGPKIKLPDGIHIILPKSPRRQRIAAQEAAGLVSREARFLLSYYADSDGDFREYKTRAFICVSDGRVIGLLVGRHYACTFLYRLDDKRMSKEMPSTLCAVLEVAWVLSSQRCQGIGKKMLREFLEKLEGRPFGVQVPLTQSGEKLLRSLNLTEFWIP